MANKRQKRDGKPSKSVAANDHRNLDDTSILNQRGLDDLEDKLIVSEIKALRMVRDEFPDAIIEVDDLWDFVIKFNAELELPKSKASQRDISRNVRCREALRFLGMLCIVREREIVPSGLAFSLGRLVERVDMEYTCREGVHHATNSKQKSMDEIETINLRKREKTDKLKQAALDAIDQAKLKNPERADDRDFLIKQAAKSLNIGKRAVYKRLAKD